MQYWQLHNTNGLLMTKSNTIIMQVCHFLFLQASMWCTYDSIQAQGEKEQKRLVSVYYTASVQMPVVPVFD